MRPALALWAALLCLGCAAAAPALAVAPCAAHLSETAHRAPALLEARARSMTSDRRANLSVTFEVKRVLRTSPGFRAPAVREHVRVQVSRTSCWGPPRVGRLYLLMVDRGSASSLRLLAPPAPRRLARKLEPSLRPRNPGRVAGVMGLRDVRARAGEKVKLSCRARGRPPPKIAWFKDGRPIIFNPHKGIRLQKKKRRSTLVIVHAKPEDSGKYECRAVELGARPAVSKATLTVQSEPRDSTIWGAPCPMPDPSSYCLNGGTCLFFEAVREAACKCPEGFNGQRCENKDVSNRSSMYHSYTCKLGLSTSYYC